MKMFHSWVLRGALAHNKQEVRAAWTTLHNEKLHNLYSSPNTITLIKSRMMRWAAPHAVRMAEMRNAHKNFIGKPEGERSPGNSRRRLEDNIKIDLREMEWDGVNWIHLAQDRYRWWDLVNMVMNLRVP
jgi:hypothetical protein